MTCTLAVKITGVQLENQTNIEAKNIICNADPPAVYEKCLLKIKIILSFLIGKKIEWNILWDYSFTILELKKLIAI